MKIYVCGPIRTKKNYNLKDFWTVTQELRRLGHEVVCPLELDFLDDTAILIDEQETPSGEAAPAKTYDDLEKAGYTWENTLVYMSSCNDDDAHRYLMKRDLSVLLTCDIVFLLPGFSKSAGGAKEIALAKMALMQSLDAHEFVEQTGANDSWLIDLDYTEDYGSPQQAKYGEF